MSAVPLMLDWRATLRAETVVAPGVTCLHEVDVEFMCAPSVALDVARETAGRIGFVERATYHVIHLARNP